MVRTSIFLQWQRYYSTGPRPSLTNDEYWMSEAEKNIVYMCTLGNNNKSKYLGDVSSRCSVIFQRVLLIRQYLIGGFVSGIRVGVLPSQSFLFIRGSGCWNETCILLHLPQSTSSLQRRQPTSSLQSTGIIKACRIVRRTATSNRNAVPVCRCQLATYLASRTKLLYSFRLRRCANATNRCKRLCTYLSLRLYRDARYRNLEKPSTGAAIIVAYVAPATLNIPCSSQSLNSDNYFTGYTAMV